MVAKQANALKTEQTLLTRITQNSKGKLVLPSSSSMRLDILLKAFEQGERDAALLKKHPNLQAEDLEAARLYAAKLARGEKVEIPAAPTAKIIPLPTANQKPAKPTTAQQGKTGGKQSAKPATPIATKPVSPVKTPSATKPVEGGNYPATSDPPKATVVRPTEPEPVAPARYGEKVDLKERTTNFGLQIMQLYQSLPQTTEAQVIGNQVFRSGTSVGAHYREAMYARTETEFVSKIEVGLQELEETKHWLQLLVEGKIVATSHLTALRQEADELTAIFIALVNLTRTKRGK